MPGLFRTITHGTIQPWAASKLLDWALKLLVGGVMLIPGVTSFIRDSHWEVTLLIALVGVVLALLAITLLTWWMDKASNAPADYPRWDRVDPLTTWQAAYLWIGLEPDPEKVAEPLFYSKFSELKTAISAGAIQDGLSRAINQPAPSAPNKFTPVYRSDLRGYALSRGERPLFLFPEDRS